MKDATNLADQSAVYDLLPPAWVGRHDPPGSLPEALHRALKSRLARWADGLRPQDRFLDLGCGRGELMSKIRERRPDLRIVGLDASEGMIHQGRRLCPPGLNWVRGNALSLPFRDRSFEAVAILDLLAHFDPVREAPLLLSEALRISARWVLIEIKNQVSLSILLALRRMAGAFSNAKALQYFLGWDIRPEGQDVYVHVPGRLLRGVPVAAVLRPWPVLPAPGAVYVIHKPQ